MFEDAIARLSDDELQKLERPNLGDLSFGEALPNLRRVRDLLIGLNQQDSADVFPNLQAEVSQHVTQVIQYVDQVQAFTVDVSNPADQRRSLLNGILGEKNWFLQQVRPHIRAAEADVAALQARAQTATAAAEEAGRQAAAILDRLQKEAGVAAASTLSPYYKTQAEHHKKQADVFLKVLGGAVALTLAMGLLGFIVFPIDVKLEGTVAWFEWLRQLLPRLFVVGVAVYAVSFAARNYRVNKHLQVVNEQRRNALDTYGLFQSAVSDATTRDIATTEILHATFQPADTGYLSTTSERTIVETTPGLSSLTQRPPAG